MVDVGKPKDEYLFQALSHGRKRYSEIKFLGENTRWNKRSLADRCKELPEEYELIEVEEEDGIPYYYREDIGSVIRRPKPEAVRRDVLQLLDNFELQLGMTDRRGGSETLPKTIYSMLSLIDTHRHLLSDDELITRFFKIFDEILERTAVLFSSENSPREHRAFPIETLLLFFILVDELQHQWKIGNENIEFDSYVRDRIAELVASVEIVPPALGELLRAVITNVVDRKADRESYKAMVRSGSYDLDSLVRHAHFTFSNHSELHKLREDLVTMKINSDQETAQMIQDILDEMRRRISRSD